MALEGSMQLLVAAKQLQLQEGLQEGWAWWDSSSSHHPHPQRQQLQLLQGRWKMLASSLAGSASGAATSTLPRLTLPQVVQMHSTFHP